jgi:hypothetical protein
MYRTGAFLPPSGGAMIDSPQVESLTPGERAQLKHEIANIQRQDTILNVISKPYSYVRKSWGDVQYLDWDEKTPFIYEMAHGGHQTLIEDSNAMTSYFSQQNIDLISKKLTELLDGVDPQGRRMIIPDTTIRSVMSAIYAGRPGNPRDMTDMVMNTIVQQIKDETEIIQQNNKLSQWVVQYNGDYGIKSYPEQKRQIRRRRPTPFIFGMRY